MQRLGDLLRQLDVEPDQAAVLITAAEAHARDYGADAARHGATVSDTVEAFFRFLKPVVDELAVLARRMRLYTSVATALLAYAASALVTLLSSPMTRHTDHSQLTY